MPSMPRAACTAQALPHNVGLPRRFLVPACAGLTPTHGALAAVCPGPFAPPVLGNLPAIARIDPIAFIDHCRHKYGSLFKVWIWPICRQCLTAAV